MSRAAVADPPEIRRKMMRELGYVTAITRGTCRTRWGVLAVKVLPETRRGHRRWARWLCMVSRGWVW